jgi:hypothetical protein
VSDLSGCGVGVDVVKRTIQDLERPHHVQIRSECGMTIALALPLRLAVIDGARDLCDADLGHRRVHPPGAHRHQAARRRMRALQIRRSIVPLVHLAIWATSSPGFVRDPAASTVIVVAGSNRARLARTSSAATSRS